MKALSSFTIACSLVLALSSRLPAEDAMHWETNLDSAKQLAARSNKLLLVHFTAPWCKPCQSLERDVFSKPAVAKELKANYVLVKLNVDHFATTARQYGVQAIPTDVVLTPQGQLVDRMPSPPTAAEFVAAMNRAAQAAKTGAPVAVAARPVTVPTSAPPASQPNIYPNAAPPITGAPAAGPMMPATNAAPPTATPPIVPQQPAQPTVAAPQRTLPPPPSGNAPWGLEGFCPVSLCERRVWVDGDTRYGMQHRGRTYLFAGPEEQRKFAADPDRYSPVMSCNDPVLELDQGRQVEGKRTHGLFCEGHIYLFESEGTLQHFLANYSRYIPQALQARR